MLKDVERFTVENQAEDVYEAVIKFQERRSVMVALMLDT